MSYTAKVYYVLESDVSYTLKYITPSDGSITVGDSFVLQMSDFDYNNKHYYSTKKSVIISHYIFQHYT